MEISIKNQQKKIKVNPQKISRIVDKILQNENVAQAALTVVFVTHQKIRALNQKYLNKNYATDVLAFNLSDDHPGEKAALCGDVVISADAVLKNAEEFKTSVDEELTLYVIHGMLHLLGYDDHHPKDIKRMRLKEKELMAKVGS